MKIIGIEGMSFQQVEDAVAAGGRFVIYQYCVSVLVMSFKRHSNIHFVPAGASAAGLGTQFVLVSLLAGWWGIPWGPIWTLATVVDNAGGGIDVTNSVLGSLAPRTAAQPVC